eukprot:350193-Chlamydomonas_euryale.AAC.13
MQGTQLRYSLLLFAWVCMVAHGPASGCMGLHEGAWVCIEGSAWGRMGLHGGAWVCMGVRRPA